MAEARATAAPVLRAAACTHPGRVRPTNEDVPVVDMARGVFGVIDGIGGHAGGEVAAAMAKDIIAQRLTRPLGTPAERVREAIAIANNTIYRRATDCAELAGMACVITLAIVTDGRLTIGHVGDTRLYKLRADGIRKLTRDHSPVGEREDAGELSEADAMRHPHRNEVFRDVGTIFRDKDEQEFVDVIEEPLEADAAILICSDGLSDMLPGSSIAHIVRQHAGNPEDVVEALVAAANDAGGRDNVTVVYAEMPLFARTVAAGYDRGLTPTEPPNASVYHAKARPARAATATLAPVAGTSATTAANAAANATAAVGGTVAAGGMMAASGTAPAAAAATAGAAAAGAPAATTMPVRRVGGVRRVAGAIVSSRMTWFTIGALAGVLGAVGLTAYVARTEARGSQTLIVAPNGTSPFASITAALAAARPGDVVRVEPGSYHEQVQLRDGIDLVARLPGTVTIIGPADAAIPVLAITGGLNVRVAGIRIESPTPVDTGILITAPAATLELVEMTGQIRHALQLSPASSVTVRGSRINVTNTLLALPDDGQATFIDSVLTRTALAANAASTDAALTMSPSSHLVLRGNVFAGFGAQILTGVAPAQRTELLAGNIVVASDEAGAATAGAGSGAGPGAEGRAAPAAPGTRRRGSSSQPRTSGGSR